MLPNGVPDPDHHSSVINILFIIIIIVVVVSVILHAEYRCRCRRRYFDAGRIDHGKHLSRCHGAMMCVWGLVG